MTPWKFFCLGSVFLVMMLGWTLVELAGPIVYAVEGQPAPDLFGAGAEVAAVFGVTYALVLYGIQKRYWRKP
jgi:hypothetical protein